ncbi:hypothetical protein AKJ09_00805 [Labilithrix luteola]|uniref:Uncharacterized protein n=1 Tax=Labilithrix luteola TaxID=1391654 RepID=A0A0K1PL53_9BACT|nr:hypothetical protein AKJ09_00805 [Labilithrix luteola]
MSSPAVDPALFRRQWWLPKLVISLVFIPPYLVEMWLDHEVRIRGFGLSHVETFREKLAFTVIGIAWIALLLWFRARHRRRQCAALAALQASDGGEVF